MSTATTEKPTNNHEKIDPTVEIEIGGEKINLVFNLWTLYKIEEVTGLNALDGATWLQPRAKDVVALLWGAWLQHDPNITMEAVAKKINLVDVPRITEALEKCFADASPPEDPNAKKGETGTTENAAPSIG